MDMAISNVTKIQPIDIMNLGRAEHGVKVNYICAWKALKLAKKIPRLMNVLNLVG